MICALPSASNPTSVTSNPLTSIKMLDTAGIPVRSFRGRRSRFFFPARRHLDCFAFRRSRRVIRFLFLDIERPPGIGFPGATSQPAFNWRCPPRQNGHASHGFVQTSHSFPLAAKGVGGGVCLGRSAPPPDWMKAYAVGVPFNTPMTP